MDDEEKDPLEAMDEQDAEGEESDEVDLANVGLHEEEDGAPIEEVLPEEDDLELRDPLEEDPFLVKEKKPKKPLADEEGEEDGFGEEEDEDEEEDLGFDDEEEW
jgi:hypothetical protein